MTASRMQRWAIILSAYDYEIEYVSSSNNCADSLSRLPKPSVNNNTTCDEIPEQTYLHFAQDALLLDHNHIKKQTLKDPILSRVLSYLRDGWPEKCDIAGLQPYFNRKAELYEELGCVMWGHRVVIPDGCRDKVLNIIHEPHMGIVKSKALARSYVWWAGIDEAVERTCRACAVCAAHADAPAHHAPRPWPWPGRPWSRVHLDFLGPLYSKTYLIAVDAMSKWIEVFPVGSTAASVTIEKLRELWSRWGVPKQVVSDNGPPFTSKEFATFLSTDGVEHIFSAPYHPSSNGAAENAVKTIKTVIKKAVLEKSNIQDTIQTFLLYYRNTEHCSTGECPAMLLTGRRLRTRLDLLKPNRETKVLQSQRKQVESAGGSNRKLADGEEIWYRQYLKGEKWQPGVVKCTMGGTDYKVTDSSGNTIHRHVDQLRRRSRSSLVCPLDSARANVGQVDGYASIGGGVRSEPSPGTARQDPSVLSPSRGVAEGEDVDSECFRTPEKEVSSSIVASPQDQVPASPAAPVPTPPGRPIRRCRLNNKPRYKF